jgi:hypothetical protein
VRRRTGSAAAPLPPCCATARPPTSHPTR